MQQLGNPIDRTALKTMCCASSQKLQASSQSQPHRPHRLEDHVLCVVSKAAGQLTVAAAPSCASWAAAGSRLADPAAVQV